MPPRNRSGRPGPAGGGKDGRVVRAAVLRTVGEPLRVEDMDIPGPGPGQVRVRLAAAGVCHSDLSLARGTLRQPLPAVLATKAPAWSPRSEPTSPRST